MASFSVSPSPYNPVKLELGVWIVFCIPVWLAAHAFILQEGTRLLMLLGYGSLAAIRLLHRIRLVQRQLRDHSSHESINDEI